MSPETLHDQLIEETRRRIEADRKKLIRYNMLMTLFVCFVIAGLAGAVYFYIKLQNVTARLEEANKKLEEAKKELQQKKDSLDATSISRNQLNAILDSLQRQPEHGEQSRYFNEIKKVVDSSITTSREEARKYARTGYEKLKAYQFEAAMKQFAESEKAHKGYRDSYEVYQLLLKNKRNFNDPKVQRMLLEEIYTKYNSLGKLSRSDIK